MDTDDLSDMAYKTLIMAESINHLVTLEIGVMSQKHEDENTYLKGILKRIRSIRTNAHDFIDNWDIETEITASELKRGIRDIEKHILKTLSVPLDKRGFSY
mgnify:CR=1 FL=1